MRFCPPVTTTSSQKDAPLANLVSDVKTEATRLIAADSSCRNTIAVLVVGGAEGTFGTAPGTSAANLATGFKSISSRRVPIYVIAIAPPNGDVSALQSIATNSGGQYFQVDQSEIDTAAAVGLPPPTLVRGIDTAVQHGMANPADVNTAPTTSLPYGPQSEFQVTSPITGSVNLKGAKDATGGTLPNTEVTNTLSGAVIPQRANVLLTSAFALPGFEMKLRAFRVYKPVADTTKAIGYKFASDGTALWTAKTPMADYCNDATASCRNIYTKLPSGSMIAFTAANASTLSPYLNTYDVTGLINFVRTQPLGAILDSTPAFMDPPSLDPPPDSDYPGFAADHEDRRTLIFVGANDGMMHALDGRSGVEVWAYIPFNLLPKLRTLRDGQGIDGYSVLRRRVGQGRRRQDQRIVADDGALRRGPRRHVLPGVRRLARRHVRLGRARQRQRELGARLLQRPEPHSVPVVVPELQPLRRDDQHHRDAIRRPVVVGHGGGEDRGADVVGSGRRPGQEHVGQVHRHHGLRLPAAVRREQPESRAASRPAATSTCWTPARARSTPTRNRAPPATASLRPTTTARRRRTGARSSRTRCRPTRSPPGRRTSASSPSRTSATSTAISGASTSTATRASNPKFTGNPTKLYSAGAAQPVFSSMAAVAVGTQEYIFVGTGSDLLPSTGVSASYMLLGVLDTGSGGTKSFEIDLSKVDGTGDDEKVSAFPAVAGDIVFFSTTAFKPTTPCTSPDAALYALTFLGGAAYDSTGDNKVSKTESPKVRTLTGAGRATAPFIVDQHLAFGAGNKIEMLGDPNDFDNGVGNVGVRIISWRDIR